jgi:hypothetical protein
MKITVEVLANVHRVGTEFADRRLQACDLIAELPRERAFIAQ